MTNYVLDNNAYILLSERNDVTGKFFGEIEGAVMKSMVELNIFKAIKVFDLQAFCYDEVEKKSDGHTLWNPFQLIVHAVKWMAMELVIQWSKIRLFAEGVPYDAVYDDEDDFHRPRIPAKTQTDEVLPDRVEVVEEKEKSYRACDKETNLYILQQNSIIQNGNALPCKCRPTISRYVDVCSMCQSVVGIKISFRRPYFIQRIPNSNLLLVAVHSDPNGPHCSVPTTASPVMIEYNEKFPCHKLNMTKYSTRRLDECFTEHSNEANITDCGRAHASRTFTHTSIFLVLIFNFGEIK